MMIITAVLSLQQPQSWNNQQAITKCGEHPLHFPVVMRSVNGWGTAVSWNTNVLSLSQAGK
jgi:hypothetical protein